MPTAERPAFAYAPAAAAASSWATGKQQGAIASAKAAPRRNHAGALPAPPPPATSAEPDHRHPGKPYPNLSTYLQQRQASASAAPPTPTLFDFERYCDLGLMPLNPQMQLPSPDYASIYSGGGSGSSISGSGGGGGEGIKPALLPFDGGIHDFYDLMLGPLSSAGSAAASCSPPESTVSGTLSVPPTVDGASVTEVSAPLHHGEGTWSASPSPLHQSAVPAAAEAEEESGGGKGGEYVCLVSRCEAQFKRVEDLALHARTAHQHVCLWGDRGPCESPGFATRDELNWHVKREHLLVCPVLGCREGAFPSPEVVDCHLKYVHGASSKEEDGGSRSGGLLPPVESASPTTPTSAPGSAARAKKLGKRPESLDVDDRISKISVSMGASKKRCREQMGAVLAKRMKRMNNGAGLLPADAESGSSQMSRIETSNFPVIWEHGVLPFLVEFMPGWCGPRGLSSHVISVVRGRKPGTRRICIMTRSELSRARRVTIAWHVRDLLPQVLRNTVTFVFTTGEIERLWARGLSKELPDEVCEPRNPFCYLSPRMGDSIGVTLYEGDGITATLGPCLAIGDGSYWLANFHPFVEAYQGLAPDVVQHPSPDDRSRCLREHHDVLNSVADDDFDLGTLTATSGYDLKTTRVTHEPYWGDCDKEPPLVVTDWSLISARSRQANVLRRFPSSTNPRQESPVTAMSAVMPGALVCSTGRTSGHQRGQVCEVPAYVSGSQTGNTTGRATREWFVEELADSDDEDAWIRGGIGVQGDSGAAVVDCETNALVGQVWGRNKYYGPGPRQSFFTPILDVVDDVQEKCGEQTRPQLPQYDERRDEGHRWPEYPVCRRCFDAREYLNSRRSSRATLLSMIASDGDGDGEGNGNRDHDLTSISELATPQSHVKTPRDTSHLSFTNPFSPASLGGGAISPMPIHTFPGPLAAKSPELSFAAAPLRNPYAQEIDDADLCDPEPSTEMDSSLGKRSRSGVASLGPRDVPDSEKRRRMW